MGRCPPYPGVAGPVGVGAPMLIAAANWHQRSLRGEPRESTTAGPYGLCSQGQTTYQTA
jgi:hypothetical protein